jgi:hypothetical protein
VTIAQLGVIIILSGVRGYMYCDSLLSKRKEKKTESQENKQVFFITETEITCPFVKKKTVSAESWVKHMSPNNSFFSTNPTQ